MRRIEINNGDNPLGKFGGGDFNPNCYPDAVYIVNNLLEIIQVFVRELACSPGDGTITIDKIGNRMVLLSPDDPTAGFEIGEIGPRVQEADDAVRDAERDAGLDASGRDLGGGADHADDGSHRPRGLYDRMRDLAAQRRVEDAATEAQFPVCEWHDGSPVPPSPLIAIGGECPICQTALISCPFDAECAPPLGAGHLTLELWAQKLFTPHMEYLDSHPVLRDVLDGVRKESARLQRDAIAGVRARKGGSPLESAYADARPVADAVDALEGTPPTTGPSSCGRSWDEAGSPVTRDAALAELQRLGQEFDAAAREFGDLGWMSPIIDAAKDLSLEELEHLVDTLENPQEPKEAPNPAEPSPSADSCETGSAASHAAQGGNPEDWRWVNPPETELAGDAHEWDALTKHLKEPRPSPVGPGQTNTTAPTLRGPLFPPPVGWVKGDAGRFPAVDVSEPIKD